MSSDSISPRDNPAEENSPPAPPTIEGGRSALAKEQRQLIGPMLPHEPEKKLPFHLEILHRLKSRETIGTLFSLVLHLLVIFILTVILINMPGGVSFSLTSGFSDDKKTLEPGDETLIGPKFENIDPISPDNPIPDPVPVDPIQDIKPPEPIDVVPTPVVNGTDPPADPTPAAYALAEAAFSKGGGFDGRSKENRKSLIDGTLGPITRESESAVERGLVWLARHQNGDGSFGFEFPNCECGNPGSHTSRIAATSLAALAFMGAGYTHKEGEYKDVLDRAFYYIIRNSQDLSVGLRMQQGFQEMYTQGLASLAVCEAYAMTRDGDMKYPAEQAIKYLVYAQNERDGGWRYTPGEPGDLSSTGWQAMALKSGHLAGLEVPRKTIYGIDRFLRQVELDGGVRFNYLPIETERSGRSPDSPKTCTAIGHLLRMYLGAAPGYTPLDEGVNYLENLGPLNSSTHCCLYYAYYSTLVMHHYGGSSWKRWFPQIRDFLVRTQARSGHEDGSWYFPDENCDKGGRLLNTTLAIMILEVPYRYMPLYRE